MKIIEHSKIKNYIYADDTCIGYIQKYIVKYYYNTEKEKTIHKKQMENAGFEDSGQVKKTIGSLLADKPNWKWYGEYYKEEIVNFV